MRIELPIIKALLEEARSPDYEGYGRCRSQDLGPIKAVKVNSVTLEG